MPRFSTGAKKVLEAFHFHFDLQKANDLLQELKEPLDISFAKLQIAFHIQMFGQEAKFLEIMSEIRHENEILQDQLIEYLLNIRYCRHYLGFNNPILDKEQTKKYFDKIEQSYQTIDYNDDWEKYYCVGFYYHTKAVYDMTMEDDYTNAIISAKKCIANWAKIPVDGEKFAAIGHNNLGILYLLNGNFKEAEKSFTLNAGLSEHQLTDNMVTFWSLGHLSRLNFLRGDLQKAKDLTEQRLEITRQIKNPYGIFTSLTERGDRLYQEGNYDEAHKSYLESIKYRKQFGDALTIFWGYFNSFQFYYRRYKISKDNTLLLEAEQTLNNLEKLTQTHSDHKTIVNYTNYARSLLLKHGNVRKRARAIDILEEMIEEYPKRIDIALNLLELLFEDVVQSEDQDTLNQINELMGRISNVPLRNNPLALIDFISQQIFLAKFDYYIKGKPSQALDILNDAKNHVESYKFANLTHSIDKEIDELEKELTKWENIDMSVKERIKQSKFDKFIADALKIVEQSHE
ncbi:MAG: tetratricopeptide repeat protein [Candidatus Kariarchaeaceae archaeon]|jgi:tetratricopeptide (TPR) repeat protein